MPPKTNKPKHAPHQHDKRHENGLAPPGKRVTKQRSNGQLNGQSNGKPVSTVQPPQLPSTGLNQGIKFPRPADNHQSSSSTSTSVTTANNSSDSLNVASSTGIVERGDRQRQISEGSVEELGHETIVSAAHAHDMNCLPATTQSPRSNARLGSFGSSMGSSNASSNPLSAVSTILAFYPMRDAISILILLLSLPTPLVLVIQTLFASLTFVPPTAGFSLSSLPSFKDLFNSSTIAAPALWTIILVDLGISLVYMLVGTTLQRIMLDIAQVAIAVSLSGAAAGNSEPSYSVTMCSLFVCVVHVLRYRAIHLTALDYLRSVINLFGFETQLKVALDFSSHLHSSPPIERGWLFTLIHTTLGIHILSQGITTCIRRMLVQANENSQATPSINRTDTEAAIGSDHHHPLRTSTSLADMAAANHANASADLRNQVRESRARDASNKKKKKIANQTRGQQPLWAAIASTKFTFVREVEQRETAGDAREAAAMDSMTSTTFSPATNRIWLSEVRDNGVTFRIDLDEPEMPTANNLGDAYRATGIDKTKPFYVQINGAAWGPTTIQNMAEAQSEARHLSKSYICDVYGLSPLTSYHCEIISIASQTQLCSVRLITQAAPSAEQTASQIVQPLHPNLRPSSPITTLRQSIQSAEAKLNDVRNRTRKSKKDQRSAHSDMKKEINTLKSKLDSSGGVDDKQERRLLQIKQHKTQAEDATAELKRQIEALGEPDQAEVHDHDAQRQAWQSASDAKRAASRQCDDAKADHDRDLQLVDNDISAVESRKEKLLARINQRTQELERLAAKQQSEQVAKQTREAERQHIMEDRTNRENELRYHIGRLESDTQTYTRKANEIWQQINNLSGWNGSSTAGYANHASPPTPEAILNNKTNGSSHINGYSNAFYPSGAYGNHPQSTYINSNGVPRGRSSSMLSQISGFTDGDDEFGFAPVGLPHQNTWPMQPPHLSTFIDRKASTDEGSGYGGSGSLTNGSTNGSNSPRPDAKVFIPGTVAAATLPNKSVGTIGPPGKKAASNSPTVVHAGIQNGTGGNGR